MRLIDADELIEVAHRIRLDSRERIERMIEDAPTIDPIKHGHWISCDDDGDSPYKCSVCGGVKVNENGEWLDICHQEWSKMPYCAVCGAKMDEVKVNNSKGIDLWMTKEQFNSLYEMEEVEDDAIDEEI